MTKQEVITNIKQILIKWEQEKTERKINKILNDDLYIDEHYGLKREQQDRINKLIKHLKDDEQEEIDWLNNKTFIFKRQTREGIYLFNTTPDAKKNKIQYQVDINNNTYYWTRKADEKL